MNFAVGHLWISSQNLMAILVIIKMWLKHQLKQPTFTAEFIFALFLNDFFKFHLKFRKQELRYICKAYMLKWKKENKIVLYSAYLKLTLLERAWNEVLYSVIITLVCDDMYRLNFQFDRVPHPVFNGSWPTDNSRYLDTLTRRQRSRVTF